MLPELDRAILRAAAQAAVGQATPFYLFDPGQLRRQVRAWRRAARASGAEIFYPYKCNRVRAVAETVASESLGAEVTSVKDLRTAERLGVPGARIAIQGPAKSPELLDRGLAAGALFVADGSEDARALLDRARAGGVRPKYLLRLAPGNVSLEQRPFGLPAREVIALARELSRRREPSPEGLAFHLGTGIPSAAPHRGAIRETAAVARELAGIGAPVSTLDFGGGFAAQSESRFDERGRPLPASAGPAMLRSITREARRLLASNVRLLCEPGRALVSGSFHLVARVVRVKSGRPPTAYLDASRVSCALFVARGLHPIASIPRRRGPARTVTLAGPLGVAIDIFTSAARLPAIEPGDLVVIGSVGAYNLNAANEWAGPIPPVLSLLPSPSGRGAGG